MPLNISVVKTNSAMSRTDEMGAKEYTLCLKEVKKAGIGEIITINISCPNAYGGEPFTTPERLELLLGKVDKIGISKPIFIKMPSDKKWPEFRKLIDVALKHKVAGLTICNLQKDRSVITEDVLNEEIKGNLSGKPVFEASNDLISKTYKYCGDKLTIIGVGGIFNAADAYQKIIRGASLVELITGMVFEGPMVIGQINAGLAKLIKENGYANISEAIGSYHRNSKS
jgi:dihydroorotate dehydrogenase (fumarate)